MRIKDQLNVNKLYRLKNDTAITVKGKRDWAREGTIFKYNGDENWLAMHDNKSLGYEIKTHLLQNWLVRNIAEEYKPTIPPERLEIFREESRRAFKRR